MKCPKCKGTIDTVNVYSECVQTGRLKGRTIIHYDTLDEILSTLRITCPLCGETITDYVNET